MELVQIFVAVVGLIIILTNHGADFFDDESDSCEEPEFPKVSYDNHQLWRVFMNNHTLNVVQDLEIKRAVATWKTDLTSHVDVLVNPHYIDKVTETFRTYRIKYTVNMENIQVAIERNFAKGHEHTEKSAGHGMNWKSYHRLETIYGYLWHLAQQNPDLCTVQSLGKTAEGRQILMLKISNRKPSNKKVWVDGGLHGREWISPAAVAYIIHRILHDPSNQMLFLKDIDWYIVPVLNPDGYEYTHTTNRLWRKNRSNNTQAMKGKHQSSHHHDCFGVDLNKNFGYQWNALVTSNQSQKLEPCSSKYRGRSPFSEKESTAVAKFFLNNAGVGWTGFIDLHSYGQMIVYPFGIGKFNLENEEEMKQIALRAAERIHKTSGAVYTVNQMRALFTSASGTITDWARDTAAIKYTFMLELRDTGQNGFLLSHDQIYAASKDAWTAVETIAEAIANDDS